MMNRKTFALASVVGVAALAVVIVVTCLGTEDGTEAGDTRHRASGAIRENGAVEKRTGRRIRVREHKDGEHVRSAERKRPDMALDADEESSLTGEILAVYRALQEALDRDDRKRVFALVRQLQLMDEWPDGIPVSVKKRALSALAWFGSSGLAESIGFLEDSNPEVRESTIETFERQLEDSWDSGDRALSQILIALTKVVSDADALDSFYSHLDDMRPSVRAGTVAEIYNGGNETAKQVLDQNLENIFATDDTEVKTREDVTKALQEATAEEESDPEKTKEYDELYGPTSWDW